MKLAILAAIILAAFIYSGTSETTASRCMGPTPQACQRF
jgi:hypothetical protein